MSHKLRDVIDANTSVVYYARIEGGEIVVRTTRDTPGPDEPWRFPRSGPIPDDAKGLPVGVVRELNAELAKVAAGGKP